MKKITSIFILAFVLRLIFAFVVWHPDVNNHIDWGIRFWQYGPAKFFAPETNVWSYTWPNQPPGTIYLFAGIRKIFEALFAFFWWINVNIPPFPSGIITFFESNFYPALLKFPGILADLGIAFLIYKFITDHRSPITDHQKRLARLGASLFLINPAVWYNSTIWGQYDSVVNFLALIAFYLLLKRKLTFSLLAFSLSLYTKASLLIFVPIYLVVALRQKYSWKQLTRSVLVTGLVIGLLTLPFSRGEPFGWLFGLYQKKVFVQQLHVITANAFNLWAALAGIHERPDSLPFLGSTYQSWGYILFSIAYLPTLYLVYKKQDAKSVLWALSLSAFSSFMLLTNMHERYLFPLFAPFTVLAVLEARLMPIYWAVSGISLINLWHFWWVPKVQVLVDLISAGNRFAPRLLGILNFGLFAVLYRRFIQSLPKDFLRLLSLPRLK